MARPWDAITDYQAPLPVAESFEVYPNRDSYPFIDEYRFDKSWKVRDFVRGTLRLNGWAKAWTPVFREIETLSGPEGDARLAEMATGFLNEGRPTTIFVQRISRADDGMHEITRPFISLQIELMAANRHTLQLNVRKLM